MSLSSMGSKKRRQQKAADVIQETEQFPIFHNPSTMYTTKSVDISYVIALQIQPKIPNHSIASQTQLSDTPTTSAKQSETSQPSVVANVQDD